MPPYFSPTFFPRTHNLMTACLLCFLLFTGPALGAASEENPADASAKPAAKRGTAGKAETARKAPTPVPNRAAGAVPLKDAAVTRSKALSDKNAAGTTTGQGSDVAGKGGVGAASNKAGTVAKNDSAWPAGAWKFDLEANRGNVPDAMYEQGKTVAFFVDPAAELYVRSVEGKEDSLAIRKITRRDDGTVTLETTAGTSVWTKLSDTRARVSSGSQSIVLMKVDAPKP